MELFDVSGKVAVVTGGSRGIGFMIASALVDSGVRVYITARKAKACDGAAARLASRGECISIPADLSRREEVARFASEVTSREPRLNLLVNNAGAAWGAPLDEYPDEAFDKIWSVNVKALFHLTVALRPSLRAAASSEDPSRVINIGSVDGIRVPEMQNYAYSASKAAVHMLTRHLAKALLDESITVNAIAPGLFPSKMTAFLFSEDDSFDETLFPIPLGRPGRPEDIAGAVIYLASRAGAYLTGAVIPVDGGVSTLS